MTHYTITMILSISVNIISLILISIVSTTILKSWKYLKDIANTSKDFVNVFNAAKNDGALLFSKIKKLSDSTEEKENHILHTVFYLENIEMYVKKILKEFKPTDCQNSKN